MNRIAKRILAFRTLTHIAFNYYDELKTTRKQQELSIGEYVDEIVDEMPKEVGFVLPKNINEYELTEDNFLDICAQEANSRTIIKNIIDWFTDGYEDEFDSQELATIKRNMRTYLKTNFLTIAKHAYDIQYSKDAIKKIVNKEDKQRDKLVKIIREAYDNVARWLKEEKVNYELANLDDDDIIIEDLDEGTVAEVDLYDNAGEKHAKIWVSPKALKNGNAVLMNTIYHELIHCIKGQADEARSKLDDEEYDSDKFQDDAHNDEIWNTVAPIITRRSGYNITQHVMNIEEKMNQLNQPHEASIICYNCGWFNIYTEWNETCERAMNNQLTCPICGTNNIELLFPDDNEIAVVNDALEHLNNELAKKD